ncbi:GntR family transcriptional regulator [Streptomyces resistomycificus]|uniref:GntR family transcriptional regulator n=2 Tax=Streptomyces resistomycificus TaxID=67356 RepID=A0A0L8LGM9_9ACTN|nr:aminotransferase class I/II-fold pyridoxal phosphate-dependent enzyme [Streptomyces resistomycificus]KOG37264.1 GntR family transcriptional regulator [Streptomyces resistomycificus]KUN95226.1 GntR family transcriptional regulator [Streptomyces resistomycificus]
MSEVYRIRGRRAAEIASSVEKAVTAGVLAPGSALPPLRDLAAELGVNPNTVASAYRLLRERGVIETGGRRGSHVRPRTAHTPRHQIQLDIPHDARDLSHGNPSAEQLPPLTEALHHAAAEQLRDPVLYGRASVDEQLWGLVRREFLADGVPPGPIAVTSGALDALERVLQARLRPGDLVAVEDPGWGSLLDLLPALGLRAVGVGIDDDGPRPDGVARALASGAAALVVTSRAQNPTGAALGAHRAAELREVLRPSPGVLVIEDDFGHAIADAPYHPLCAEDGRPVTEHWTVIRSVTKIFGPDMRLAVLTGDSDTVDRIRGRQRLGAGWVSHVLQRAVAQLWKGEAVDRTRVAGFYGERRAALILALAEQGVRAYGRSGFNVWIPVPDETVAVVGLMRRGWAVAPGARFRLGSRPGLRVTVSTLGLDEIPRLAADVAAALRTDLSASSLA